MSLHIDDPEVDRLASELASLRGESTADAVRLALHREVERERDMARRRARIRALQEEVARLPLVDTRTADEILGYDENGLPT